MLALAPTRASALAFLARSRDSTGAWGYLPGQAPAVEPTLLAAAAGAGAALDWLGQAKLGWGAGLLPAALSTTPGAEALCRAAMAALLTGRAARLAPIDPKVLRLNTDLLGWSWVPGTSAWVEPTSYALIGLKRGGQGSHPFVAEGAALLRDRQCQDGGWNYGNPEVYGKELESDPGPTGWAVLALGPDPAIPAALVRLRAPLGVAGALRSTLSLSMATLAHITRGDPATALALAALLAQRQLPDGSFAGRCDWTALAAVALGACLEGSHVFAV